MPGVNRRRFAAMVGAGAATTLALPTCLRAQGKPRVVVVGGGAGGATAARHIAKDSKGEINVTLVEAGDSFTTCFFSNLYLGGLRDLSSLTHSYDRLQSDYGIRKVTGVATAVDGTARSVTLADGSVIPYDRLVLSPGIDLIFDSVPGYSEEAANVAPHAWKSGAQAKLLKTRLDALADGQNIVMVAPPNPYRCPPGPYERVSMMAHVLRSKGFVNSSIFVIDAKSQFSKQTLFEDGWAKYYPGMIEWYGADVHGGVTAVDVASGRVETELDSFTGELLNIIPAQRAGDIAFAAGVAGEDGFCPVDPASMRSTRDPAIFVIGDASVAGDMPKSAFSANSQAKVAAMTIRADLLSARTFPARYTNTCWSLIEVDDGVKVGAHYEPRDGKIAVLESFVSQPGEAAEVRKATYEESVGWYSGIVADIFG